MDRVLWIDDNYLKENFIERNIVIKEDKEPKTKKKKKRGKVHVS